MHALVSPGTSPRKPASAGAPQMPDRAPDCLLSAINMLSLGIVLADGTGRIAFANLAAKTLLRLRKGARGVTTLDRPFRDVIRRGRTGAEPQTTPHIALTVSGSRSLFVLSAPCPSGGDSAPDEATHILFIGEPSHHALQDLSPLASHYRLTRAETRLLQALVKGDTIGTYAKRAGITHNTAKGYLKQLFRKTFTTRQSDLVRLILANPILHLVSSEGAARKLG
jgi:DNA-binding CsgD family transcriptional regulator